MIKLPLFDQQSWYCVPPLFSDFNPKPWIHYTAVIITAAIDFFVVCCGSLEFFFSPTGRAAFHSTLFFINQPSVIFDFWINEGSEKMILLIWDRMMITQTWTNMTTGGKNESHQESSPVTGICIVFWLILQNVLVY